MAYATPQDFINRFDARVCGDLVNDSGNRITASQLMIDDVIQACLDDGAGEINIATLVGQRYTVAQLEALTGVDMAVLVRLNCDIAFYLLALRRGVALNEMQKERREEAKNLLTNLKNGERIFNVPGDVSKGTLDYNFPSIQSYDTLNLLRDASRRYFVGRREQHPVSS